jgi:multisubunit Na+/H+ antiporter MnhG subunit
LFVACLGALLVSQLTFATDLASVGESVTFAALGALPIGVLLLRDYSRMKAPTLTGFAATVLGLLSSSILALVRNVGWPLWLQATVLAFAAACCLGAIHMRRRWLLRLPVALPAGRMAD